jgi:hypothetical protein
LYQCASTLKNSTLKRFRESRLPSSTARRSFSQTLNRSGFELSEVSTRKIALSPVAAAVAGSFGVARAAKNAPAFGSLETRSEAPGLASRTRIVRSLRFSKWNSLRPETGRGATSGCVVAACALATLMSTTDAGTFSGSSRRYSRSPPIGVRSTS